MSKWTPEAERHLAEAWNAGVTSRGCAERFGTSPGAIIAKLMQMRQSGVELRSRNQHVRAKIST